MNWIFTLIYHGKPSPLSFTLERQWIYQTCTEFGYFQTSDSKNQPFGSQITIDLYTLICQNVFNLTPDKVQENIKKTNEYYGGKNIPKNVTNIVFPNGSIDPWHALGITQDVSPDLMAVFINGTAHCANMYPSSKYDRPELLEARAQISSIMGQWLGAWILDGLTYPMFVFSWEANNIVCFFSVYFVAYLYLYLLFFVNLANRFHFSMNQGFQFLVWILCLPGDKPKVCSLLMKLVWIVCISNYNCKTNQ